MTDKTHKTYRTYLIAVGVLFCWLASPNSVLAAATLSLTPTTGSVAGNATMAVELHLNTGGEAVNTVQADLAYGFGQLSTSDGGIIINSVDFPTTVKKTVNQVNGQMSIIVGLPTPGKKSDDVRVATITFTGKGVGVGTVSFLPSTAIYRDGDAVNIADVINSKGGSYTVTAAVGGSAATTTTPTPTPTPTPTVTPTQTGSVTSGVGRAGSATPAPGGGDSAKKGASPLPVAGFDWPTILLLISGLCLAILGIGKRLRGKTA